MTLFGQPQRGGIIAPEYEVTEKSVLNNLNIIRIKPIYFNPFFVFPFIKGEEQLPQYTLAASDFSLSYAAVFYIMFSPSKLLCIF